MKRESGKIFNWYIQMDREKGRRVGFTDAGKEEILFKD